MSVKIIRGINDASYSNKHAGGSWPCKIKFPAGSKCTVRNRTLINLQLSHGQRPRAARDKL